MNCSKCNSEMMEGYTERLFSGIRDDGEYSGTETTVYMCKKCGYIEEYAKDPEFYLKKD